MVVTESRSTVFVLLLVLLSLEYVLMFLHALFVVVLLFFVCMCLVYLVTMID